VKKSSLENEKNMKINNKQGKSKHIINVLQNNDQLLNEELKAGREAFKEDMKDPGSIILDDSLNGIMNEELLLTEDFEDDFIID